MKYITSTLLLFFLLLTGCQSQKDMPEPEVKFSVIPMSTVNTEHDMPAVTSQAKEPFMVQHHVRGSNVYIECMIPSISFREDSSNQGKIILYIDGVKKEEIQTAAFIVKGLGSGNHRVKLEVVKPNNEPYQLQKEFMVSIP
jgi:hypothetical protein